MSRRTWHAGGIILFGGTFNPVHKGHIRLCCSAVKAVQSKLVIFMPTQPFYKTTDTSAEQRLEMCKRAVDNLPFPVIVDDYELKQGIKCRTYDTICYLKEKYPCEPLYLLFGSDTFLTFSYWYNWHSCGRLVDSILVGMRQINAIEDVLRQKEYLEQENLKKFINI